MYYFAKSNTVYNSSNLNKFELYLAFKFIPDAFLTISNLTFSHLRSSNHGAESRRGSSSSSSLLRPPRTDRIQHSGKHADALLGYSGTSRQQSASAFSPSPSASQKTQQWHKRSQKLSLLRLFGRTLWAISPRPSPQQLPSTADEGRQRVVEFSPNSKYSIARIFGFCKHF